MILNTSLEYISAGTIFLLILGVTGQHLTNMVYDRMSLVDQNAKFEKADKILDMLLLSNGSPIEWGESSELPETLGLALTNSIKRYELDPEKVLRLSSISSNYIPPGTVRDILGLSPYYYIKIKLYPIFNLTITRDSVEQFSVKILNQWNIPVSNVNLSAAYLNNLEIDEVTKNDITSFMDSSLEGAIYEFGFTDSVGTCTLDFLGASEDGCLLILASQLTGRTLTAWPSLPNYLIGNIDSSMGSTSGYNTETVFRSVKIDRLDYIIRFTLWGGGH